MNIAIILAGGSGTRLKSKIPKQLLLIDNKPIFIHTVEQFLKHKLVDKVILVFNEIYIKQASDYLEKFFSVNHSIDLIKGGNSRNDSIYNAYLHLKKSESNSFSNIILTHDSVRMLVSEKLISDSIEKFQISNKSVCVPVVPILDSIIKSEENDFEMIDRNKIFKIQTPQVLSFETLELLFQSDYYHKQENSDWELCWLAEKNNCAISTFFGSMQNIKITTKFDLEIVFSFYKNLKKNKKKKI